MTWPALLLWLLILISIFVHARFSLYLFFLVAVFGGLSLLPPGAAGNVPPETVCAAVLIMKTFAGQPRINVFLRYALDVRKLGILTIFSVYMVATAYIYPRLFAGQVQLYSLNSAGNISFLGPTSANITQSIYMLVSIAMAFVFADCAQSPEFRRHFLYATLAGASLLLLSGVIDLVLGDAGREDLLAPFHNATYHLLDTVSVAGQKRVVGFMPEASVFGSACCTNLGFLVFNRDAYEGRLHRWVVPAAALGLFFMAYASTSSAAYIGLGIIAIVATVKFIIEMTFVKVFTPRHIRRLLWAVGGVLAGAIIFAFLSRAFLAHIYTLLDAVLFQKSSSSSFAERNSWTHAGIAAFIKTDGIGVGVGSIRTSNWLVNFAASTGVVGLLLFGSFAIRMLFPGGTYPDRASRRFANGLKLALIPGFIVGSLAATTPNPGSGMMLTFGMIYALQQKRRATIPAPGVPVQRLPSGLQGSLAGPRVGSI